MFQKTILCEDELMSLNCSILPPCMFCAARRSWSLTVNAFQRFTAVKSCMDFFSLSHCQKVHYSMLAAKKEHSSSLVKRGCMIFFSLATRNDQLVTYREAPPQFLSQLCDLWRSVTAIFAQLWGKTCKSFNKKMCIPFNMWFHCSIKLKVLFISMHKNETMDWVWQYSTKRSNNDFLAYNFWFNLSGNFITF